MIEANDPETLRQAIRRIRFFSDVLDSPQLDGLADQSRIVRFGPGQVLMAQGDFGSTMFGILGGAVEVTYLDSQERERDVAMLTEGEIVGEIALLTGERRTATVTALSAVYAIEISKTALERIVSKAPDLVEGFGAVLALRKAGLEQIEAEGHRAILDEYIRQIRSVFRSLFGSEESRP